MKIRNILEEFYSDTDSDISEQELLSIIKTLGLFRAFCSSEGIKRGIIGKNDRSIILHRHIADSMLILKTETFRHNYNRNMKLADFGTGGGFPGLVLSMVLGDPDITLFDSKKRRLDFIHDFLYSVKSLNDNSFFYPVKLKTECCRIEDKNVRDRFCETFDLVTSRAFYPSGVTAELVFPYLKTGQGMYYYYGGRYNEREISSLKKKIENTDLQLLKTESVSSSPGEERKFIIFKKTGNRPGKWPGKIKNIKREWENLNG